MQGVGLILLSIAAAGVASKGLHYKVHCGSDSMRVEIVRREEVKLLYLQNLKDFPEPACKPRMEGRKATFELSLDNIYQCMLTKVVNKKTGSKVYYHRVVVEYSDSTPKESILVKCDTNLTPLGNSSYDSEIEALSIVKRQAEFPASFNEEDVEITSEVTGHAPSPVLNVGVRQDGVLVDDELNVKPGTPLNMEIYLDNISKDIYGLLVSGMEVTDTRSQTEPILVNGCSVDPYLFENFNSVDGDFLKAKFRAFKFPESSFVLFKGTVNVCLDTCKGVQCSNGQLGYGRRRREIYDDAPDPNKVYEISMSTIIKMECEECQEIQQFKKIKELELMELKEQKINILHETAHVQSFKANEDAAVSALFEDFKTPGFSVFEKSSASKTTLAIITLIALFLHF